MDSNQRLIEYRFTEADVIDRSPIAKAFLAKREIKNGALIESNNRFLKRFLNLDTNAYLPSESLPAKAKELMGLSVSTALRCESCIYYHLIQSFRLGASRQEIEETLNVALIIGGSIVIPSLRQAYEMLNELLEPAP